MEKARSFYVRERKKLRKRFRLQVSFDPERHKTSERILFTQTLLRCPVFYISLRWRCSRNFIPVLRKAGRYKGVADTQKGMHSVHWVWHVTWCTETVRPSEISFWMSRCVIKFIPMQEAPRWVLAVLGSGQETIYTSVWIIIKVSRGAKATSWHGNPVPFRNSSSASFTVPPSTNDGAGCNGWRCIAFDQDSATLVTSATGQRTELSLIRIV